MRSKSLSDQRNNSSNPSLRNLRLETVFEKKPKMSASQVIDLDVDSMIDRLLEVCLFAFTF